LTLSFNDSNHYKAIIKTINELYHIHDHVYDTINNDNESIIIILIESIRLKIIKRLKATRIPSQ